MRSTNFAIKTDHIDGKTALADSTRTDNLTPTRNNTIKFRDNHMITRIKGNPVVHAQNVEPKDILDTNTDVRKMPNATTVEKSDTSSRCVEVIHENPVTKLSTLSTQNETVHFLKVRTLFSILTISNRHITQYNSKV